MKKFELSLLAVALLAMPSVVRAGEFSPSQECLKRYAAATGPDMQAASEFLSDASDDFDYPSMDQMTLSIRAQKGLKAWDKPDTLDSLNVDISYALEDAKDKVCGPKLLGLAAVQEFLVQEALPAYFAKNPPDAAELGWK